eukprot:g38047.t1
MSSKQFSRSSRGSVFSMERLSTRILGRELDEVQETVEWRSRKEYAGWLGVGGSSKGRPKCKGPFKKRFCVLRQQQLSYYRNVEEEGDVSRDPLGIVDLSHALVDVVPPPEAGGEEHVLRVYQHSSKRFSYLRGVSLNEERVWLFYLRQAASYPPEQNRKPHLVAYDEEALKDKRDKERRQKGKEKSTSSSSMHAGAHSSKQPTDFERVVSKRPSHVRLPPPIKNAASNGSVGRLGTVQFPSPTPPDDDESASEESESTEDDDDEAAHRRRETRRFPATRRTNNNGFPARQNGKSGGRSDSPPPPPPPDYDQPGSSDNSSDTSETGAGRVRERLAGRRRQPPGRKKPLAREERHRHKLRQREQNGQGKHKDEDAGHEHSHRNMQRTHHPHPHPHPPRGGKTSRASQPEQNSAGKFGDSAGKSGNGAGSRGPTVSGPADMLTRACREGEQTYVVAWGLGMFGQLGTEAQEVQLGPVLVPALTPCQIRQLACGMEHAVALSESGRLWVWGRNDRGQLGLGSGVDCAIPQALNTLEEPVKQVACGDNHSLALSHQGNLYSWGAGESGQLGHKFYPEPTALQGAPGLTGRDALMPQLVAKLTKPSIRIRLVAAAGNSSAAIANEHLCTWGANTWGQLGNGTTQKKDTPIPITSDNLTKDGPNIATVVMSTSNLAVILKDGSLYSCGSNSHGQLGFHGTYAQSVLTQVKQLKELKVTCEQVTLGRTHMTAIVRAKAAPHGPAAITWGSTRLDRPKNAVSMLDMVKYASSSESHGFFLHDQGRGYRLWGVGTNHFGELGTGDRVVPVNYAKCSLKPEIDVLQVACGRFFSLALCAGPRPAILTTKSANKFTDTLNETYDTLDKLHAQYNHHLNGMNGLEPDGSEPFPPLQQPHNYHTHYDNSQHNSHSSNPLELQQQQHNSQDNSQYHSQHNSQYNSPSEQQQQQIHNSQYNSPSEQQQQQQIHNSQYNSPSEQQQQQIHNSQYNSPLEQQHSQQQIHNPHHRHVGSYASSYNSSQQSTGSTQSPVNYVVHSPTAAGSQHFFAHQQQQPPQPVHSPTAAVRHGLCTKAEHYDRTLPTGIPLHAGSVATSAIPWRLQGPIAIQPGLQ